MNILGHVYDVLYYEDHKPQFIYIPIEGELIYREPLDINDLYDPIAPTHQALPHRQMLWRTSGQARIIPWRLSRNLDHNNVLYDLEIKAQVHAHDPRYQLDFICNPDRSPGLERQEEELATTMYLAAAAGARYDAQTCPVHDPRYQLDFICNPTNGYTSTYPEEFYQTVERDTAGQASYEAPSHQHREMDEAVTHGNEEHNVYDPPTSHKHAYDRNGHSPDGVWPVIQNPEIQRNAVEFNTHSQQKTTPAGYPVSEPGQSYEDSVDADAVSALSVDDFQGSFQGYADMPPLPSLYPAHDTPEFDWFLSDLGIRAANAYLMQLRGQYEDDTGQMDAQPRGVVVDNAADSPPDRHTYDLPRRPVPNRSCQQPGPRPQAGPAQPGVSCESFRPALSRRVARDGHQEPAEIPRHEDPRHYAQQDRGGSVMYEEHGARGPAREAAAAPPAPADPLPKAHTRRQLFDRGRRATRRLFGGVIGR